MTPAPSRAPARWPLLLAIALSLAALAVLVWLRSRLAAEDAAFLANTVRVFEETEVLGRPEAEGLSFAQLESLARTIAGADRVRDLLVAKQSPSGRELVVYPYYHELANPGWRGEAAGWRRLRIGPPDAPSGWLYLSLDPRNRRAVDGSIAAFLLLLVTCLGLFVARQQGKEAELSRTVSELEERKAEIIRLERLALAGQLSANILHDIKKPVLNIKHAAADLLDEPRPTGPGTRQALLQIRQQTDLFLTILRDLGIEGFVRAEREEPEYCDLHDIAQRSAALVRYEQRDIDLRLGAAPADPALVLAPPHRLVQLLSNLLLNAYQACGAAGTVWVDVDRAGTACRVSVEDTGPGIDPAVRDRLFEPFTTTKSTSGGSGLGLYICSRIARDLGGTVTAHPPARGNGARFVVQLPTGA